MNSLMKPAVVTVHGIRTVGAWQKQIATAIASADMVPYSADFGFFSAASMCLPHARDTKISWIRRVYDDMRQHSGIARPSVICHSFGTWLIGELLRRYDDVLFDKIVLAGSILPVQYDWNSLLDHGRVLKVRNEVGTRDPWPAIAGHVSSVFGPAGSQGFATEHRGLEQRFQEVGHSDTFYDGRFREWANWIRFDTVPHEVVADLARVLASCLAQYTALIGVERALQACILVPCQTDLVAPDRALVQGGKVAPSGEIRISLSHATPAVRAYRENRVVTLAECEAGVDDFVGVVHDEVAAPIRHPANGRVMGVLALANFGQRADDVARGSELTLHPLTDCATEIAYVYAHKTNGA
jgi:pimeloyl-ACP methyl ester carboxylesterase